MKGIEKEGIMVLGNIKIFNKYVIIFLVIQFIIGIGVTFAYLSFQVEDTTTIVGKVVNIDADIEVELVSGNNGRLVPLKSDSLNKAINGIGSDNGACIDNLNNLSCQVYKITLTNNGGTMRGVNGYVSLKAKTGSNNTYTNLKWRELENLTTIKSDSIVNGMGFSILVSNFTIASREVKTWYIAVYLEEVDDNQQELDKGDFEGNITFTTENMGLFKNYLIMNDSETYDLDSALATISSKTYSTGSVATTTGGLYQTVDDYSIDTDGDGIKDDNLTYFYRGVVDNNWVEFGGFLWRIVRINGNGSIRMIYSGSASSTSHTGSNAQIGTTAYAATSTKSGKNYYYHPTSVGYMYNPNFMLDTTPKHKLKGLDTGGTSNLSSFLTYSITSSTTYYFFDNFDINTNCSLNTEMCTFTCNNTDTDTTNDCLESTWATIVADSSNYTNDTSYGADSTYNYYSSPYKYACTTNQIISTSTGTTTVKCYAVTEILGFNSSSTSSLKIRFHGIYSSGGETDTTYVNKNVANSQIKSTVDTWYKNNILNAKDSNNIALPTYLSDEIFCNDRSVFNTSQANGYNFDLGYNNINYGSYNRLYTKKTPSLVCSQNNDKFTVSSSKGNGALTYPVGLITADETSYAGGKSGTTNKNYYLYTGSIYWTMAPYYSHSSGYASAWYVNSSGNLNYNSVRYTLGARPVINLISEILYDSGDGTEFNPYIVRMPE